MNPVLTIIDGFLPEERYHAIRKEALERGFQTEMVDEGTGAKVPYENVQVRWMPTDFAENLPLVFGMPLKIDKQAFRFGYKDSQLHNLVHADHCCSKLAAVYYMNHLQDCQGGTAFWRHKGFGWEFMPNQDELSANDYTIEELARDWHNPNAWEMVSLAGMAPNRLITYPTAAFHSRWPWGGFGEKEDPERARLIWCGFFDIL